MSRPLIESDRISFPLDDGSFENLHARKIDKDLYIIDNSPFYAYNVSYQDIVCAKLKSGRLVFDHIKVRGGHSTYRVRLSDGVNYEKFIELFKVLSDMGCTFEGTSANGRQLYSIDMPPMTDVDKAYRILESEEKSGAWEFEEAHFFKGYSG